ncbi:MAG: hypothetical protein F6K26_45535 [Moorea sp. SIO2I5]|nr:hypothetical protein [Moorena sp. SIO2I5]
MKFGSVSPRKHSAVSFSLTLREQPSAVSRELFAHAARTAYFIQNHLK